jgi:alpha-N-arabinofuranosidase
VSISASKGKNGSVHISIVNVDSKKENKIEIDLKELGIKDVSATILTSSKLQDYNSFENPNKIQPKNFTAYSIKKGKLEITIPPFSIAVLEGK